MNNVKVKDYRLSVIILLAMMPIMMSAVEYKNMYQSVEGRMQPAAQLQTTVPSANFQSTSTLTGSGSALSATPMLGEDGTVTYEGANYSPAKAPGGPLRDISNPTKPTPIGDAVLPLLLMSLAFGMFVYFRRKQTLKS